MWKDIYLLSHLPKQELQNACLFEAVEMKSADQTRQTRPAIHHIVRKATAIEVSHAPGMWSLMRSMRVNCNLALQLQMCAKL